MTTKNPAGAGKDTIYIDVDDEITTIIDKLRSSPERIVALVLPKRATVFQGIVNMKLLKRTADNAKKHVVLITSEASLLSLAGSVGLYVAATPQSKPEIPPAPGMVGDNEIIEAAELDDEPDTGFTAENAGNKPIGELAKHSGATALAAGGIETLSLDNDEAEELPAATTAAVAVAKKNKKLKVPNFNKFRLLLVLGGVALLLLIVGLVFALKVLPKAAITITTDATDVNSSMTLNLDTAAKTLDKVSLTLPAKIVQQQKTQSQQVATTGSKNNGDKATGSITLTAQKCAPNLDPPSDIPAGTGVSAQGVTYITQGNTQFAFANSKGSCINFKSTSSTSITAQAGGAKYNAASATFAVAGRSDVAATGSASGGTDSIVKVVQQADIDGAKQKISTTADTTAIKQSLVDELHVDGLFALPDTFDAGEPSIASTSNVGDPAENVTVTATYTYTMYGTDRKNLDTLVNDDIKTQVDTSKETILTNGVDKATVRVISSTPTSKKIGIQTIGTVGPDLHFSDLKKQSAGKKSGDVIPMIKNLPGVKDVTVHLSPFWVNSVPSNPDKITVITKKTSQK